MYKMAGPLDSGSAAFAHSAGETHCFEAVSSLKLGQLQNSQHLSRMKIKQILPPIITSALLALAFPNAGLWPLAFIALIPLLIWVDGKGYRQAFFGGTLAGLVFYAIVFSWFASLTYWVGGIVLLGVGILLFFFSLFWGVVMVGGVFFSRWLPAALAVAFPSLWVLMEYAHNHIFTGFGWGSVGYTQWNSLWVAQLASVGSVYAVSFYVVLINVLIVILLKSVRRHTAALVWALALVTLGIAVPTWGKLQMHSPDMSSNLQVGVVQPNFSLDVKWDGEYSEHMMKVLGQQTEIVAGIGAELVIWPESAFYGYLVDEISEISEIIRPHDIYLLTGSNHYERSESGADNEFVYYNSAFLIDPKGQKLGRYDKHHLAPFGEYVPLQDLLPFMGKIVPAVADFTPGTDAIAPFIVKGKKFGVLICFENSFPHLVRRAAVLDADFLVQLTNDGWFGRSGQPKQDLAIAVFRSIENGATLVRGTNTGISCFIDPWGRVSGMVTSPWGETVFARGISVHNISTVAHDTVYKTYGDIYVVLCAGLFAGALGLTLHRRKMRSQKDATEAEEIQEKEAEEKEE
jgi:apolipoprotein N-acyltransferase